MKKLRVKVVATWPLLTIDSLNVNRMNAKEGGCQPLMHDTIFEGKQIVMTKLARNRTGDYVRIPRGMIDVLMQRGRYHPKMKVDDTREELAKHHDFRDEKQTKTSLSISFMNIAMLAYSSPSFIVKSTPLNAVGLRLNATPGHTAVITL